MASLLLRESRMMSSKFGRALRAAAGIARDTRGVTLVEALIAAVVVGIAAVGVALMLGNGQAFISAEGDNRVAVFLAQQRIEQVRAYSYAGLVQECLPPSGPTVNCPSSATAVNVSGTGVPGCVAGET